MGGLERGNSEGLNKEVVGRWRGKGNWRSRSSGV